MSTKIFQNQAVNITDAALLKKFEPVRIIEIELGQPLPIITAYDPKSDKTYRWARLTVRLHTMPIGLVNLELIKTELRPVDYMEQIWQTLHHEINEHLQQDGLAKVTKLDVEGLVTGALPACLQERVEFLNGEVPFVTVIVCTHDRPDQFKACIEHLLRLDYPEYEVLTVDNAPDGNEAYNLVSEYQKDYPNIRYIREDRQGLSWALNCGLHNSRSEIVAVIDDDVTVDRYWLTELILGFRRAENVGCVSGLVLPGALETQSQKWFEDFNTFTFGFKPVVNNIRSHRLDHPLYPYNILRYAPASNGAFKTSVLRELGGYCNVLGPGTPTFGGEDIEIYFRIINRGYTSVYHPRSLAYHYHRRTYQDLQKQVYGYGVAFVCFFIQSLLANPQWILRLLPKTPLILQYLLSSKSQRHAHKQVDYPNELRQLEWKGIISGPVAYLRSRWRTYKLSKKFARF